MEIAPRPHQVRRVEVFTDEDRKRIELESSELKRVALNRPPADSGRQSSGSQC